MGRRAHPAIIFSMVLFGLAACEDGFNLGGTTGAESQDQPAPRAAASGVADVERPDIFNVRDEALWDGRPSLGGIWIAHPDVKEPERVIITNESNGKKIAGALFRRERDTPGPSFQLSSDAAAALNVLAGQPTMVSVVAVRQEEITVEEAPPVISDESVGEDEATSEDGGSTAGAIAGAAGAGAADAADAKPRGNFFQRLFGIPPKDETQPESETLGDETADDASAPEVETQTLDPVTTGAAAAIARAEASDKPQPRPASAPAPQPSGLKNPFIQVGLFSGEESAADASSALREAGIGPTVLQGERDGKPIWRVVVGPVTTADEQAAILGQVRRLGYGDAFLTDS